MLVESNTLVPERRYNDIANGLYSENSNIVLKFIFQYFKYALFIFKINGL